ncbi:Rv3235 family protein [Nocardiaceae bacterium NPDC056970]
MQVPHRFISPAPQFEPPTRITAHPPGQRSAPEPRAGAARRSPHDGRSPRTHVPRAGAESSAPPELRRFTEHTLRLTLEVLDGRRPPAHLRPLLTPSVNDLVPALVRSASASRRLGGATLTRIHVRVVRADAAEVFGTYNRGGRVFAVAARIERGKGAHPAGWAITSLRIA